MKLTHWHHKIWGGLASVMLLCGLLASPLSAQEKSKPKSDAPFLVVNVASLERLLANMDYMFASAERPELSEMVTGALSNVRDLKGFQREKSFGMLLFLNGFVPEPIGYMPVDDIEEFTKTAQVGPITTKKISEDRYELIGPVQSLQLKVVDGYAYIARNEAALNRTFDNPAKYTQRLTNSYDVSASLNMRAIPKSTRDFFLDFIRANSEANAQQRDNEPEAAFRLRRAAEMNNIENTEMLLGQAEEITLGWTVSAQDRQSYVEMVVIASPKSDYAKFLNQIGTTRSRFAPLLSLPAPMTFSMASILDPNGRSFLSEALAVAEKETLSRLVKNTDGTTPDSPIAELYQSLRATMEAGQMDACVQLLGEPPGPFSVVGGVRLSDSDKFQRGITEILEKLKGRPELESVELNIAEHKGVQLHRVQGKASDDKGVTRFLGQDAGLYVGTGDGIVWFALGGEDALPALKEQIDVVAAAPTRDAPAPPMEFVLHLSSFLWLADTENGDQTAQQLFRDAFAQGGDAIRMEMKPLPDGARFRLTFEEGFIRLVGKSIGLLNDSRN